MNESEWNKKKNELKIETVCNAHRIKSGPWKMECALSVNLVPICADNRCFFLCALSQTPINIGKSFPFTSYINKWNLLEIVFSERESQRPQAANKQELLNQYFRSKRLPAREINEFIEFKRCRCAVLVFTHKSPIQLPISHIQCLFLFD